MYLQMFFIPKTYLTQCNSEMYLTFHIKVKHTISYQFSRNSCGFKSKRNSCQSSDLRGPLIRIEVPPVGRGTYQLSIGDTGQKNIPHPLTYPNEASHLVSFPIDPSPSVPLSTLSESISVTSLRSNCFSFHVTLTPVYKFVMLHGVPHFKKQVYPCLTVSE